MSRSSIRFGMVFRLAASLALVMTILAPVWLSGAVSAQESLPPIAEAVPESAVAFHWTDLDRESSQWRQAEELLARVGAPDALELWEESVLNDGERSGGITKADLDALLGGEMAIVVLPGAVEQFAAKAMAGVESDTLFRSHDATPTAAADAQARGILAVLRPSDIDAAWAYAERQFADAAAEMGAAVEEGAIGDAEVLTLPAGTQSPHSGEDADADGMGHVMGGYEMYGHGGFAAARAGDYIVAGKSEADLTEAVRAIEGDAGSLADSAEVQAVVAELPEEALTFTYVDGQGILDVLDPEMIAMLRSALMETPVELLGSQFGMTISADAPGFRFDSVTILNDAVDLDAYTVENNPAVATAAEQAPAGTFLFQAGRLAENAFDGVAYKIAQAVNAAEAGEANDQGGMMFPTEEEMTEEIAAASATLGFDVQTDLIDLLGDEFVAFSSFPSLTFEDFGVDAVAAISTSDPDALAETMQKIAAWIDRSDPGVDIVAGQLNGDRVYAALSEGMEGAPGLEFGVVGERAVVGIGGGIEALTTEPTASLAEDEQYQTVMGLLPDTYYQAAYLDIGRAIDPLINLIGLVTQFSEGDAPQATPEVDAESLRNLRALGAVSYLEGNISGSSAILYIDG